MRADLQDPARAAGRARRELPTHAHRPAQRIDAAVKKLAADGFPTTDEMLARLSSPQFDHIKTSSADTSSSAPTARACDHCGTQTGPRTTQPSRSRPARPSHLVAAGGP